MSLLEEIQREVVDSKGDLAAVLRKCRLLAARLGSQPLEDWLVWEADGYPAGVTLPQYRLLGLELKGHFSGPFQSGLRNAPIPLRSLPEKARKHYKKFSCRQSIASIEVMVRDDVRGTLEIGTGDLAAILGMSIYQNQNCFQAWGEIGKGELIEVLNSVRNRVLDFTIALWKVQPDAGEQVGSKNVGAAVVTQIFNTTVYGGAANLVGSATGSQIEFNISTGDTSQLVSSLREIGVDEVDINELVAAVQNDGEIEGKTFGKSVSQWIGKMVNKAAEGVWNVGVGAAGQFLATALGKYYGIEN